MEARLSLVTLSCKNIEATSQFYKSLGWKETEFSKKNPDIFFYTMANGLILCLYPKEELEKDTEVTINGNGFTLAWNAQNEKEQDEMLSL